MGNANPAQKDRLRAQIGDLEGRLLQMSLANATSSARVYKPLGLSSESKEKSAPFKILPDAPKMSDYRDPMQQRLLAEQKKTKFLAEVPKLSDAQKQMFSDHPSKELYKKTDSGPLWL